MSRYTIETWETDRGWSARDNFYRVEAEGGKSEDAAVDCVVGTVLAALSHRDHPPRYVEFTVRRQAADADKEET